MKQRLSQSLISSCCVQQRHFWRFRSSFIRWVVPGNRRKLESGTEVLRRKKEGRFGKRSRSGEQWKQLENKLAGWENKLRDSSRWKFLIFCFAHLFRSRFSIFSRFSVLFCLLLWFRWFVGFWRNQINNVMMMKGLAFFGSIVFDLMSNWIWVWFLLWFDVGLVKILLDLGKFPSNVLFFFFFVKGSFRIAWLKSFYMVKLKSDWWVCNGNA